jgi:hypothetical protein
MAIDRLMRSQQPVYRIEWPGESAVPFPALEDAMRQAPGSAEATIVTSSPDGVVLAESTPSHMIDVPWRWRPTVAGLDVLRGGVRGMERVA